MTLLLETVEKVAMPLFRMGEHEIFTSISGEIVGKNFARGVISDAHVIGNDVTELLAGGLFSQAGGAGVTLLLVFT